MNYWEQKAPPSRPDSHEHPSENVKEDRPETLRADHAEKILSAAFASVIQLSFPDDFKTPERVIEMIKAVSTAAKTTLMVLVDDLKPVCHCENCKKERHA